MSVKLLTRPNNTELYCSSIKTPIQSFVPKVFGGEVEIPTKSPTKCTYQVLGDFCYFRMGIYLQGDLIGVNLNDFINFELPITPYDDGTLELYYVNAETSNISLGGTFYDGNKSNGYISNQNSNMFLNIHIVSSAEFLKCNYLTTNTNNVVFIFNGFYRI
jgi:hypothetical protein